MMETAGVFKDKYFKRLRHLDPTLCKQSLADNLEGTIKIYHQPRNQDYPSVTSQAPHPKNLTSQVQMDRQTTLKNGAHM